MRVLHETSAAAITAASLVRLLAAGPSTVFSAEVRPWRRPPRSDQHVRIRLQNDGNEDINVVSNPSAQNAIHLVRRLVAVASTFLLARSPEPSTLRAAIAPKKAFRVTCGPPESVCLKTSLCHWFGRGGGRYAQRPTATCSSHFPVPSGHTCLAGLHRNIIFARLCQFETVKLKLEREREQRRTLQPGSSIQQLFIA